MTEDKVTISKSKLEKIIEQKVDQRLQKKTQSRTKDKNKYEKLDRRQFMKKAGLGTAGLAALGLAPASALNINSNEFSVSTGPDPDSLTEHLSIGNGNVKITNGNLDLKRNAIDIGKFRFKIDDGDLVIEDDEVELIRQKEQGKTQFIQGIDAGPLEAPEDTFSQIINTPVTDDLNQGDKIGHTLAINNQTVFSVEAEADGSGGINRQRISINKYSVSLQSEEPSNPDKGDIWIDNSVAFE